MYRNIRCQGISCTRHIRYGPYVAFPPDPPASPTPPISQLTVVPIVNRYVYIPQTPIDLRGGATIRSTLFYDDNENEIDEFTIHSPNGYVNLHINGVMQRGGLYEVDPKALTINPAIGTIRAGTSIIIETLGFVTTTNV